MLTFLGILPDYRERLQFAFFEFLLSATATLFERGEKKRENRHRCSPESPYLSPYREKLGRMRACG